jgi:hypothetical protein
MSSDTIERRLAELRELASKYAKAEAQRTYLEEFKRSKLSMLMKVAESNGHSTSAAQEREARSSPQYMELLDGLRVATEQAEESR